MRHLKDGRKLGRTASHRRAMMRNLVTSLFREERVKTTEAKAKEARRLAERLITRARGGSLADRRTVAKDIHDDKVLRKLFGELGPRFADRPGGYTRILRLGVRDGDGARTAMLELLGAPAVVDKEKAKDEKKRSRKDKKEAKSKEAEAAKAEAIEEPTKQKKPRKAAKKEVAPAKETAKKDRKKEEKPKKKRRLGFPFGRRSTED